LLADAAPAAERLPRPSAADPQLRKERITLVNIINTLLIGGSLLAATAAPAATFATRASFDAATASQSTLTFDATTGDQAVARGASYTEGGATFTDTAIYTLGPQAGGYAAGFEYGSGYLEWQSGTRTNASVLDIALPGAVTAFALDFYELRGEESPFQILVGGQTFNFTTGATPSFFGFTSNTAFSSLRLTMPALVRDAPVFPTIDNFSFGQARGVTTAVPEPATWAMMLIGFAGVGVSLRRRRVPATMREGQLSAQA
jgi:PEP-CTERM motif